MKATRGISDRFITLVADSAMDQTIRFSERLLALPSDPVVESPVQSRNRALALLREVSGLLDELDLESFPETDDGWASWLIDTATAFGIDLDDQLRDVLRAVGRVTPQSEGIGHFLNQLEPVTRDVALESEGVAIMSMSRSKGLTRRARDHNGCRERRDPLTAGIRRR